MAVAYFSGPAQLNCYRTNSVLGLTPGELLIKMYDIAVVALMAGDGQKGARVISEFIDTLDFEQGAIAMGLFRLYRYCMEEIKKGEYEVPTRILRELRDTWAEALAKGSRATA